MHSGERPHSGIVLQMRGEEGVWALLEGSKCTKKRKEAPFKCKQLSLTCFILTPHMDPLTSITNTMFLGRGERLDGAMNWTKCPSETWREQWMTIISKLYPAVWNKLNAEFYCVILNSWVCDTCSSPALLSLLTSYLTVKTPSIALPVQLSHFLCCCKLGLKTIWAWGHRYSWFCLFVL